MGYRYETRCNIYEIKMTITRDDVLKHGYVVRRQDNNDTFDRVRSLLFLDAGLGWNMASTDCGSRYWYNVSIDAKQIGKYDKRKYDTPTIGYPVTAMTICKLTKYAGDFIKVDGDDKRSAYMRIQDIVFFFNDDIDAIRRGMVCSAAYTRDPELATDKHVRLYPNYDTFVTVDALHRLERLSMDLWKTVHYGIPGML